MMNQPDGLYGTPEWRAAQAKADSVGAIKDAFGEYKQSNFDSGATAQAISDLGKKYGFSNAELAKAVSMIPNQQKSGQLTEGSNYNAIAAEVVGNAMKITGRGDPASVIKDNASFIQSGSDAAQQRWKGTQKSSGGLGTLGMLAALAAAVYTGGASLGAWGAAAEGSLAAGGAGLADEAAALGISDLGAAGIGSTAGAFGAAADAGGAFDMGGTAGALGDGASGSVSGLTGAASPGMTLDSPWGVNPASGGNTVIDPFSEVFGDSGGGNIDTTGLTGNGPTFDAPTGKDPLADLVNGPNASSEVPGYSGNTLDTAAPVPDSTGNINWDKALSDAGLPAGSDWADKIKELAKNAPPGTQAAIKAALGAGGAKSAGLIGGLTKLLGGDPSGLDDVLKGGLPLAMLAGLFQNTQSPLVATTIKAAEGALGADQNYGALPALTVTPTQQRAIDTANANVGAFKPYVDAGAALQKQAGDVATANVGSYKPYVDAGVALTTKAAGGIPSVNLSDYLNPFMQAAIDPAADVVRRDAAKKQMADSAAAGKVGAFGGTSAAVEKAANTRDTQTTIGNLYKTGLSAGFDKATGLATTDLDRMTTAGKSLVDTGKTVSTLGNADATALGSAGTDLVNTGKNVSTLGSTDVTNLTNAGALESLPQTSLRDQAKTTAGLYNSSLSGLTGATNVTKPTNTLGQAVGALGALTSAQKLGLVDGTGTLPGPG